MPTNQYVVFQIENRGFAIEIDKVKTIEKVTKITRVPGAKDFVIGVINLRGEVIPVFDTRKRIGLGERCFDNESRIIILNIEDMEIGITADIATEVIHVDRDSIDGNPDFAADRDDGYIKGIVRLHERIIAILDLKKLLKIK